MLAAFDICSWSAFESVMLHAYPSFLRIDRQADLLKPSKSSRLPVDEREAISAVHLKLRGVAPLQKCALY